MADHPVTPRPPRHPDTDDQFAVGVEREVGVGAERVFSTRRPWARYAFVFIAIVLVVGMVVLHLTGVVGPGAH